MVHISFMFARLLSVIVLLQDALCFTPCLDLETGDITDFDITEHSGNYNLVLAILGDGPLSKLPFKCNSVTLIEHAHPNGGQNVLFSLYIDSKRKVVGDTFLGHMNSTTSIYIQEIAGYHHTLQKWTNLYGKVLQATDDLFVYSVCVENEDDKDDTDFLVIILRKEDSKLSLSEIQAMLPESIKTDPKLAPVCNE